VFSLSLSAKYKTEELESFHTIDEAFIVLAPYINNPFWLPFIHDGKRHHLQTQQKRVGTIITQAPTFKNASDVIIEMKEKDFCNSLRVSVLTIYVYYIQDFKILKNN
jgi:endonuclease III-like uncharacterized protein